MADIMIRCPVFEKPVPTGIPTRSSVLCSDAAKHQHGEFRGKGSFSLDVTPRVSVSQMVMVLYRVLAAAELKAPPGARGAFIPVSSSFDAYAALAKLLGNATQDILIVDPYLDETVLVDFGGSVPSSVLLRLLSDQSTAKSAPN